MAQHTEDADVQRRGLWLLRNISAGTDAEKAAMVKVGAIELAKAAMAQHTENTGVQQDGMWLSACACRIQKFKKNRSAAKAGS